MWLVATEWSSTVCQSVMTMSPAKVAEPIMMPFRMLIWVGPRNHVLDWDLDPLARGSFEGDDIGIFLHVAEHRSQWPWCRDFPTCCRPASNWPPQNQLSVSLNFLNGKSPCNATFCQNSSTFCCCYWPGVQNWLQQCARLLIESFMGHWPS